MTFTDALSRELKIRQPPTRIVSLVPSITEALFAFGVGYRVHGVTRFCVEPPKGVRNKTKVGGTKQVDVARVLEIGPDLVIANQEENTLRDVQALIDAGLPVFVTFARTVASAINELAQIGEITGASEAAAPFVRGSREELERAMADKRPSVRVFCPIWRNPWMTVNGDTYIHDMLRVCGGDNVFADHPDRYPRIDLQDVASRHPGVVILPDEPFRFSQKHIPEVIEKVGDVRIHVVDGKYLCWYGPRIPESIRFVRSLLRGEVGM